MITFTLLALLPAALTVFSVLLTLVWIHLFAAPTMPQDASAPDEWALTLDREMSAPRRRVRPARVQYCVDIQYMEQHVSGTTGTRRSLRPWTSAVPPPDVSGGSGWVSKTTGTPLPARVGVGQGIRPTINRRKLM